MMCSLARKVSLAALVLLSAIPAALAQTGPGGPAPLPMPGNPALGLKMTPDRLVNLLRGDGHQVDVKTFTNGGKTVVAAVNRDGWRFVVEFEFNPNGTNMNVICPLGNPASQFSAAQLLALMKKSYDLPPPMHFSYRASDQRLCLEDPVYGTANMSDDFLRRNILDRIIRTARETYSLWNSSQWPINGAAPAVTPVAPPALPGNPLPKPAAIQDLAGATFTGSEDLGSGYGKLTFKFLPGGQAVMIDARSTVKGTYTVQGNQVVITLPGVCTYQGTLNGSTFSGTGRDATRTWNFTVNKQ